MYRHRISGKVLTACLVFIVAPGLLLVSRPGAAQTAPPFPTKNAVGPRVTTYEQGMAQIKAKGRARPKAVTPGFMQRPANAGQGTAAGNGAAAPPAGPDPSR